MFKKAGYIILISLLILSTVGFVVSRHYCNNQLISVSVDSPADKCSDNMKDDCCNDKNKYVVLHVDFTQPVVEEMTISEINIFSIELDSLFKEVASANATSNPPLPVVPIAGHNAALSLIQSFLL